MADTLADRVAAIAKRGKIAYNEYEAPPQRDFDALVAAVEAVLAIADGLHFTPYSLRAIQQAEFRDAITRALTGEDGPS